MKVLRVYTDTSVIGGCFYPGFSLWSNRLIQDFQQGRYIPVVSSVVATEIDAAPEQVRVRFEEILRLEPVFLELTEEAVNLSEIASLSPLFKGDHEVRLRGGRVLRLSRRYKDELFARMPR